MLRKVRPAETKDHPSTARRNDSSPELNSRTAVPFKRLLFSAGILVAMALLVAAASESEKYDVSWGDAFLLCFLNDLNVEKDSIVVEHLHNDTQEWKTLYLWGGKGSPTHDRESGFELLAQPTEILLGKIPVAILQKGFNFRSKVDKDVAAPPTICHIIPRAYFVSFIAESLPAWASSLSWLTSLQTTTTLIQTDVWIRKLLIANLTVGLAILSTIVVLGCIFYNQSQSRKNDDTQDEKTKFTANVAE